MIPNTGSSTELRTNWHRTTHQACATSLVRTPCEDGRWPHPQGRVPRELDAGHRTRGGQRKRYKDVLRQRWSHAASPTTHGKPPRQTVPSGVVPAIPVYETTKRRGETPWGIREWDGRLFSLHQTLTHFYVMSAADSAHHGSTCIAATEHMPTPTLTEIEIRRIDVLSRELFFCQISLVHCSLSDQAIRISVTILLKQTWSWFLLNGDGTFRMAIVATHTARMVSIEDD